MRTLDTSNLETGDIPRPETKANRRLRLAWEAAMIAEADADIEADRLVNSTEVRAWIDSIGTGHELPFVA